MSITGIVLAAGAGSRAGGPKALRPGWVATACRTLLDGGDQTYASEPVDDSPPPPPRQPDLFA